jgi:hypothetical protein
MTVPREAPWRGLYTATALPFSDDLSVTMTDARNMWHGLLRAEDFHDVAVLIGDE